MADRVDEQRQRHDDFQALHAGLSVSMIATRREHFVCCHLNESLQAIAGRNKSKFDFMPVVDGGEGNEHIVGIIQLASYFDAPAPDTPVSSAYRPLHENCLIGADASILSFVKEADIRPFRLLISDHGVVGLVSLSDLQKLPVRAALFGLVTGLEIAMTETIHAADPNGRKWIRCISTKRQDDLRKRIEDARRTEGIVTELLFTQFCDKRDILIRLLFNNETIRRREELARQFKRIEKLRNDLAHANHYAASRQDAAEVCSTVRDILDAHGLVTQGLRREGH